jgi:hypothetical protein
MMVVSTASPCRGFGGVSVREKGLDHAVARAPPSPASRRCFLGKICPSLTACAELLNCAHFLRHFHATSLLLVFILLGKHLLGTKDTKRRRN